MKILAIETSHDDTSVVLYQDKVILRELSFSQTDFHRRFGGTVPEFAARGHFDRLPKILKTLLTEEEIRDINHVAYTAEPGLVGSLHMGKLFAYAVGFALDKPVRAINHMYGHIYAVCFTEEITYPALALIVSGGHTQLWDVRGVNDIRLIGQTKDDAVGEVYDKVARYLNLGFPGGPIVDKNAKEGRRILDFDLKDDGTFDFSFSGLKTKVKNYVHNAEQKKEEINVKDVCASFQGAVVDALMDKTKRAIEVYKPKSIILGGGVSANSRLRSEFAKLHEKALIPAFKYTTDNAMMIAMRSDIKERHAKSWKIFKFSRWIFKRNR